MVFLTISMLSIELLGTQLGYTSTDRRCSSITKPASAEHLVAMLSGFGVSSGGRRISVIHGSGGIMLDIIGMF